MIDSERLLNWPIGDVRQDYGPEDCALYALGIGFGSNPVSPRHLRFVCGEDIEAFPLMAVVLGWGKPWLSDSSTGIDFAQVLHAEETVELHRALPAEGSVVARSRVLEIADKGAGRGAIITTERALFFDGEHEPTATVVSRAYCRGEGGFGGSPGLPADIEPVPDRAPDHRVAAETLPQSALLYRLSGDDNPLHVDPDVARRAGFARPILHGLCSYGYALRAVVEALDFVAADIGGTGVRFTAPVYPGETIETSLWRADESHILFRARVVERNLTVLDRGWVRLRR